jgi:RNA polymerase sigma-54 factor
MKQSLQLKLHQQLTLTPQLQQSIRLLQLSTLELSQEISQMLQDNPLLERLDGEDRFDAPAGERPPPPRNPAPSGTRSTRKWPGAIAP